VLRVFIRFLENLLKNIKNKNMEKEKFLKIFEEYKNLLQKTLWEGGSKEKNCKVKINSTNIDDYQKLEELQTIIKDNISYLDNKDDLIFIFSNETDEELKKLADKRLSEIS